MFSKILWLIVLSITLIHTQTPQISTISQSNNNQSVPSNISNHIQNTKQPIKQNNQLSQNQLPTPNSNNTSLTNTNGTNDRKLKEEKYEKLLWIMIAGLGVGPIIVALLIIGVFLHYKRKAQPPKTPLPLNKIQTAQYYQQSHKQLVTNQPVLHKWQKSTIQTESIKSGKKRMRRAQGEVEQADSNKKQVLQGNALKNDISQDCIYKLDEGLKQRSDKREQRYQQFNKKENRI